MNKDITLVVMAAGMGSRFGGLKQIAPIGKNGEILLDYSVYDAVKAGFNKVVFVIKRAIEEDFKAVTAKHIEKWLKPNMFSRKQTNCPRALPVLPTAQSRGVPLTRCFAAGMWFTSRLRL